MKTEITVKKEIEIKSLLIEAKIRDWEDITVNGVEDTEGTLTPCRKGDNWCPKIDVDTGIIQDWPQGTTAYVHCKVVEKGNYHLMDENDNIVLSIEGDYVPNDIVPGEYGDYIIMTIDETGKIAEWPSNPSIREFIREE